MTEAPESPACVGIVANLLESTKTKRPNRIEGNQPREQLAIKHDQMNE